MKQEKRYVLVQFNDKSYRIWPERSDVVWGSPLYEVIDYFSHRDDAETAIKLRNDQSKKG